jgi:hypothetical protein
MVKPRAKKNAFYPSETYIPNLLYLAANDRAVVSSLLFSADDPADVALSMLVLV